MVDNLAFLSPYPPETKPTPFGKEEKVHAFQHKARIAKDVVSVFSSVVPVEKLEE